MNVQPIPTLGERTNEIRLLTAKIVNKQILPNETSLWPWHPDDAPDEGRRSKAHKLREDIKAKVKQAGLWAPHLPTEYGGCGLTFLEHAYMNEVLAYSVGAASLFGVVAPDSGNQQILLKYGTEEQKKKWLIPLTEGKLESGFSMTEPETAGSDPRSLRTTARREGDHWVINGHKSFTSNGFAADFFIVMCRTENAQAPCALLCLLRQPLPNLRAVWLANTAGDFAGARKGSRRRRPWLLRRTSLRSRGC